MENKSLKELKGNAKNPRTINKEDYKNLVQSIKRFGDLSGIVFNIETQQLAGGHQRQKAFAEIGADDIVITQRLPEKNSVGTTAVGYVMFNGERYAYREVSWSPEFEKAANVAANRIQGEFDLDLLAEITYEISQAENASDLLNLTGQTEDEINRLLDMSGASGESDPAEDEAPEVDNANPPVSKLGEIYQLGVHRLMCGDSTDFGAVSDLMDGRLANLVFTDPPYGVDYDGGHAVKGARREKLANDGDAEIYDNVMPVIYSMSEDNAALYLWFSDSKSAAVTAAVTAAGYEIRNTIIWNKNLAQFGAIGAQYKSKHEPVLYAYKSKHSPAWYGPNNEVSVWDENRNSVNEHHPTEKPTALAKRAMTNSSKRGDAVLDLFGGSGATLIAADIMDRNCYMMELSPAYVDVIRKRYHKHTTGSQEGWQEATKAINEVSDETTATAIPTES